MSGGAGGSSRHLVQTFAAMLAHLMNGERGGGVSLEPYEVYRRLTAVLAKPNGTYVRLTGHGQMVDRTEEEAAQLYFDHVLDRRMFLARDGHTHKAHELFLALCRRGVASAWPRAGLARTASQVVPIGSPPPDFSAVAQELRRLPADLSGGNPALTTREAAGPLRLAVPGATHEVAEEMSIWGAINCAPRKLQPLSTPDDFNAFCSLVIKAVEAANAQYGTLVALGLSPIDWRDLSVNTAKKLSAFINDVRETAAAEGKEPNTLALWQAIWKRREVPGYDTAEQLWGSELGQAVRGQARVWRQDDSDLSTLEADEGDSEERMLDRLSLGRMIEVAMAAGVIGSVEGKVLRQLMDGAALDAIAQQPEVAAALAERGMKIAAFVNDIATRIRGQAGKKKVATSAARPDSSRLAGG